MLGQESPEWNTHLNIRKDKPASDMVRVTRFQALKLDTLLAWLMHLPSELHLFTESFLEDWGEPLSYDTLAPLGMRNPDWAARTLCDSGLKQAAFL